MSKEELTVPSIYLNISDLQKGINEFYFTSASNSPLNMLHKPLSEVCSTNQTYRSELCLNIQQGDSIQKPQSEIWLECILNSLRKKAKSKSKLIEPTESTEFLVDTPSYKQTRSITPRGKLISRCGLNACLRHKHRNGRSLRPSGKRPPLMSQAVEQPIRTHQLPPYYKLKPGRTLLSKR